jgi:hypothetical protein
MAGNSYKFNDLTGSFNKQKVFARVGKGMNATYAEWLA